MPNSSGHSDWQPTASIENLRTRAVILRKIRNFFDEAGFIEVQTPCLSNETVVDLHVEPVAVDRERLRMLPTGSSPEGLMYLQTSPEAAMKRLLAAGASAVYQIGPVFRSDESGPLHNPEFTMLEWYREGDSMEDGIECLSQLLCHILGDPSPRVITYRELFLETLDFDPLEISNEALRQCVRRIAASYRSDGEESRDQLLDILMGLVVAPRVQGRAVVCNYPLSQAALARRSDRDPRTAERFELFVDGVELANGYAELVDEDILRQRTAASNRLRQADGRPVLPPPARLLAAMRSGIPQCSGTALGVDRLTMAALGAERIDQVIPFPIDRA